MILCVGLDATIEGEEGDTGNEFSSGDKNDLRLPEVSVSYKACRKDRQAYDSGMCGRKLNKYRA